MTGLNPHRSRRARPLVLDYFCGGGGASHGIRMALGRGPDAAINHDAASIAMHTANHPETLHLLDDVWNVNPVRDLPRGPVELAWLSPSCTHFSRAKGSATKNDQMRALPWVAIGLAEKRRPRILAIENVVEFVTWGPLDGDAVPLKGAIGDTFRQFVWKLETLGYKVEWRNLTACDFGAPTKRERLFLVARNDGEPIVWPEPTHGPGLLPYETAASCIDFSLPVPSIFGLAKAHVDKTQARLAEGIRRYVLAREPHVVGDRAHFGVCMGFGEREGQAPRTFDLHKPLGTVVAGSVKHALAAVWIVKSYGGVVGHGVDRPLGTITCADHHSLGAATLGKERRDDVAAWLARWLPGVDTTVRWAGETWQIVDVGMRQLTPRELATAQGFPADYVLPAGKTVAVHKIGNSVSPPVAAALVAANLNRKARAA